MPGTLFKGNCRCFNAVVPVSVADDEFDSDTCATLSVLSVADVEFGGWAAGGI